MDTKTKKILWRIIQGLIITVMNGAVIAFLVMNLINYEQGDISFSYWDAISSKTVFKIAQQTNNGWTYTDDQYHFWWKTVTYLFMALGPLLSFSFIKFLYQNQRQLKLSRVKSSDNLEQKIIDDKEMKELLAKAEARELSKREKRKLEKLSKGD